MPVTQTFFRGLARGLLLQEVEVFVMNHILCFSHRRLLAVALSLAGLAATGCGGSRASRDVATPGAFRTERTSTVEDSSGSGQAHESNGKTHVAERRSAESSSRGSNAGTTRPTDRPPPRNPPPHR